MPFGRSRSDEAGGKPTTPERRRAVFGLARVMRTSVAMIEHSCGTLLDGWGADIARRLRAFEADSEASDERVEGV
jgi:hypothetical protein